MNYVYGVMLSAKLNSLHNVKLFGVAVNVSLQCDSTTTGADGGDEHTVHNVKLQSLLRFFAFRLNWHRLILRRISSVNAFELFSSHFGSKNKRRKSHLQ